MDKKILIGVISVLLLAGGVGAYFFLGSSGKKASDEFSVSSQKTESPSAKKSLKDLLGLGESQMCTFTDQGSGSEGSVFVAGEQARMDFSYKLPDGSEKVSHMIIKDGKTYLWMEGETTGYLMALVENEAEDEPEMESQVPEAVDLDQPVDYRCESWRADGSKFVLPTGVEFKDLSSLMQFENPETEDSADVGEGSEPPAGACSTCDSLPAESRSECLQAFGCE